jgi:hypothetical protein
MLYDRTRYEYRGKVAKTRVIKHRVGRIRDRAGQGDRAIAGERDGAAARRPWLRK